jgi:hypothetical protein
MFKHAVTHQALGELDEQKGEPERVRSAYADAMQVIDAVAGRLQDHELKRTFLSAGPVREIRERLRGSGEPSQISP